MLKIKSLRFILIELFIIVLLMSIGYAKCAETNMLENTSNARGKFNIQFENAQVIEIKGANKENTNIVISKNSDTININVSDLGYPGAYVKFSLEIVNEGIIPAKLESFNVNGIKDDSAIKIEGFEKITDKILEAGEKCDICFIVKWDNNYNSVDEEITNFNINISYTQAI